MSHLPYSSPATPQEILHKRFTTSTSPLSEATRRSPIPGGSLEAHFCISCSRSHKSILSAIASNDITCLVIHMRNSQARYLEKKRIHVPVPQLTLTKAHPAIALSCPIHALLNMTPDVSTQAVNSSIWTSVVRTALHPQATLTYNACTMIDLKSALRSLNDDIDMIRRKCDASLEKAAENLKSTSAGVAQNRAQFVLACSLLTWGHDVAFHRAIVALCLKHAPKFIEHYKDAPDSYPGQNREEEAKRLMHDVQYAAKFTNKLLDTQNRINYQCITLNAMDTATFQRYLEDPNTPLMPKLLDSFVPEFLKLARECDSSRERWRKAEADERRQIFF